ncbi:MAG: hypothetical protein HZB72_04065 [Burkholderiales bacterium]|nr:hypothetical protein [Burkholderiales bacterium]
MIRNEDITVVVQGAIDKRLTPICLASIRKVLPGATVVLSTWKDPALPKFDCDVLVQSEDPGAGVADWIHNVRNNVNRQIVSTLAGLREVRTKYALKIRSDIELVSRAFLDYFERLGEPPADPAAVLKRRLVVNNLYCTDPRVRQLCFHISDWTQFGLTEDVLALWDIDLQPQEYDRFYSDRERPEIDTFPTWNGRYVPEQYIWASFLKKRGLDLRFDHRSDGRDLVLSEKLFAANLVIVDYEDFGIRFRKFDPYRFDYDTQMDHLRWAKLAATYFSESIDIPASYLLKKAFRSSRMIRIRRKWRGGFSDMWQVVRMVERGIRMILRLISRPVAILRYSVEIVLRAVSSLFRNYWIARALKKPLR